MLGWRTLRSWFRSVVLRSRVNREIDDELRFHLETLTDAAVREGALPDDARRTANASLGGSPTAIREACLDQRGVTVIDDLVRDLSQGARLLRRDPGFAAVVLTTLAIAIGATVTVFSIVDAWLFRPLNFPHAERLVVAFGARAERPTDPQVWMPFRAYLAWKERSRSFASISGAFIREALVANGSDGETVLGLNVTSEFFPTLGVQPLLGRTLTDGDAASPRVVVVSYGFWQRRFGGSNSVIGTTVPLSGVPHEIVGVMPRDFDLRVLDMTFDFWTPFGAGTQAYGPGGNGPVVLLGRLRDTVTAAAAQSEVAAITRQVESEYQPNFNEFVVALASLQADNTRAVRATLLTVSAAVGCLLLIAATNVGALLLGRGLGRMREVAIRTAIGASRSRLVRQFLTESLLIAALGGLAGIVLAFFAIRLFIAWDPFGTLPANAIQLNLRVLAFASAAIGTTMAICGLVPAQRVSSALPQDGLRGGGERIGATVQAQRAQALLLVGQMAACGIILVAAILLTRTFVRLRTEPLGFEPRNMVVAGVNLPNAIFTSSEQRNLYYQELAGRLRAVPGVRAVGAGTSRPLSSGGQTTVNTSAEDMPDAARISTQDVTTDFFDTLDIPLLAGRAFDKREKANGLPVVILNARAARDLFGGSSSAIGRRVRLDREPWREVVGVVGSVRSTFFNTLEWRSDPIVYRPAAQAFGVLSNPAATSFGLAVHIRSERPIAAAEIREAVRSADSRAIFTGMRSVSELVDQATRQPSFRMTLLAWFATISLLLGAIGIYALVSQAVNQRVREFAIRRALGATTGVILAAVTRRALGIGIAGLAIGAVAAYMLGSVLKTLVYGVDPRDGMSFLFAALTLLTVTAAAALLPAFRATRVNPADVLRSE